MPRELTEADKAELTPGEIAAYMGQPTEEVAAAALAEAEAATLAAERAEEAARDKEGAEATKKADAANAELPTPEEQAARDAAAEEAAKTTEAATPGDAELDAESLAAVLDDAKPAPVVATKPVSFKGITEAEYKAEAEKIAAAKAEGLQKLMDGEIDAKAYAAIDAEQADKHAALIEGRTLARANQQQIEQHHAALKADLEGHIGKLMKDSAGTAIDYSADVGAQKQFDQALTLIGADPDNASLSPGEAVSKAHQLVQALRGIVPTAKTAAPAPPPPAAKRDVPVTLGGIPTAAPNAIGADIRAQFALLSGDDAEEFIARLPKDKRQALSAGGRV